MFYLTSREESEILLAIYVQPKSSRNRIVGIHNDMLKIAITAPPVDGKANSQVTSFLAKFFKVPKSAISIVSGHQGRKKKVAVSGVDMNTARTILSAAL